MSIKIGCDPEFSIVDQRGQRISFDMEESCHSGKIKWDHAGAIGEFNPRADVHPGQVVRHLRTLVVKTKEHYPRHRLVAGGGGEYGTSTGGHIHFSGGADYDDFTAEDYSWMRRSRRTSCLPVTAGNKLVLALDCFVGARMQKLRHGLRQDASYNLLSKIKRKIYSGNVHGFEYRSAPSFIVTPQFAEATLATAQQIAKQWLVKPDTFDNLLTRNGETGRGRPRRVRAKRGDYQLLIPDGSSESDRYYRNQVRYFTNIMFNRHFDLGDLRMVDYWTSGISTGSSLALPVVNRVITLQPCQLKLVNYNEREDFESESVFRVVRFAVPEVKVYPIENRFIPWRFRLRRDVSLKENTLYVSKNLRPFIRMPRGADFHLRFKDFRTRNAEDIESSIFYNKLDSRGEIMNFVQEIFESNVRTRLRRRDARNMA